MSDSKNTSHLINDAPCRTCDGCTDPFDCREYIDWIFADLKETAEQIWKDVNADSR